MKNTEKWRPSKYVCRSGRWTYSRDLTEVGAGSRLNVALLAEAFSTSIPVFASGNLLDLGCGQVPLYEMYAKQASSITCVDWSNCMHDVSHVDVVSDLNDRLAVPEAAFDTIILSDVLEHIYNPWQLWDQMAKVLKPGGNLILSVPFYYWLHEEPYDYYRYTHHALRRMAEERGFRIEMLEPLGGAIDTLADIGGKLLAKIPGIGIALATGLQSIVLAFGRSGIGKVFRDRTGLRFPLGYIVVAARI